MSALEQVLFELPEPQDSRTKMLVGSPLKRNALTGFATGQRMYRPQEIYTPQSIINFCLKIWPEGIALDPCTDENSIVPARRRITKIENGLTQLWEPFTYINPPYNDLKNWFAHGLTQPAEQIWLVPVRTHRIWWRAFVGESSAVVFLDSGLIFLGYEQSFPAPLCLVYFGNRIEQVLEYTYTTGIGLCMDGGYWKAIIPNELVAAEANHER